MTLLTALVLASVPAIEMVPTSPDFTLSLSNPPTHGVKFDVWNRTANTVEFWLSGFYPNHKWELRSLAGTPVRLTELGEIGAKRFGSADRDGNINFKILSGKSCRDATPPLTQAFQLKLGTYILKVIYHEKCFAPKLRIGSQSVRVIVKP